MTRMTHTAGSNTLFRSIRFDSIHSFIHSYQKSMPRLTINPQGQPAKVTSTTRYSHTRGHKGSQSCCQRQQKQHQPGRRHPKKNPTDHSHLTVFFSPGLVSSIQHVQHHHDNVAFLLAWGNTTSCTLSSQQKSPPSYIIHSSTQSRFLGL